MGIEVVSRPSRRIRLPVSGSAQARSTPFGAVIADQLERRGWTLEEGARRCGVPLATLSSYKDGRILGRGPHARATVLKIATGLGIPPEDALELVGTTRGIADEQTILSLFRRLSRKDKILAAELLRTVVNTTRSQRGDRD